MTQCIENIYSDDDALVDYSSDDVSVISVLHRDSDCIDNYIKPSQPKTYPIEALNQ